MEDRSIVHSRFDLERDYPVTVDQVFRAWADHRAKARWFAGASTDYQLEFRQGGVERSTAEVDGKRIDWESLYREIVPNERIVYTSVLSADGAVATVSLTTVEFAPAGQGTHLTLVEAGAYLDGREQPTWREQGTSGWLTALDAELTGRTKLVSRPIPGTSKVG